MDAKNPIEDAYEEGVTQLTHKIVTAITEGNYDSIQTMSACVTIAAAAAIAIDPEQDEDRFVGACTAAFRALKKATGGIIPAGGDSRNN